MSADVGFLLDVVPLLLRLATEDTYDLLALFAPLGTLR